MVEMYCDRCDHDLVEMELDNEIQLQYTAIQTWVCPGCGYSFKRETELVVYVNVYQVDRRYGGPEEGGWWTDFGYPLESIRVPNTKVGKRLRKRFLKGRYAPPEGHRDRNSVIGGPDIEVYIEGKFASAWPEEKPRYE